MISEGQKAIDFKLKDMTGKEYSLKYFSSKFTIIYFYPKDDTPGCTVEALEFTSTLDEIKKLRGVVVGISGGDEKTKKKFCEKHNLNVLLLSDADFEISKKYGVYGEKSFMGKKYLGISRVTFILDKDKKVIKVFDQVKPQGHAKEVMEFLKTA